MANMLEIIQAQTDTDYEAFQDLVEEFAAWSGKMTSQLGQDGEKLMAFFHGKPVQEEIASLFTPPAGQVFLAMVDGQIAGCARLRKFDDQRGELKRLYVRSAFRGKGIGHALLEALIREARQSGYETLLLETAIFMKDAQKLYYAAGFQNIEPYVSLPDDLLRFDVFMALKL